MTRLKALLPIFVFAAAYATLTLFVTNQYYQLIMTLVLVWAVFGLSWNLLSGYTGLISFGHAAFFGLGAYATTLAQLYFDLSPWLTIPVAAVICGVAGLLIGFPTFRLRGHYFALAMLAYPLAILYVFEWLGYQEVTLPMKRENGFAYMQFSDHRTYTWLALALLVGTVVLTQAIERSRFGMALRAIKQNEAAAEAAGINTLAWKLRAISLSGAIAGAIGGFYAIVLLVVTPQSVFGMLVSAQALAVAMFGGVGTVWGPVIGAVVLIPLAEILHAEAGPSFPGIEGVIFGASIVIVILLAPEGLFWKVRDLIKLRLRAQASIGASAPATKLSSLPEAAYIPIPRASPKSGEVVLEARGLSLSFGGLKALQNVSFELHRNSVLGIIGPNGAGKTTLFNVLNGFLKPDAGEVFVHGKNMGGMKPHQLCRAGVGRTFQIMRPFLRMTVADNVIAGAYVAAKTEEEAKQLAASALDRTGLSGIADRITSELTTKELRLIEIARALAGKPQILLLDETLAGLGHGEADEVVALIRKLSREDITVAIIEHTMEAMVRLVDRVSRARSWRSACQWTSRRGHAQSEGDRSLSRQEVDGPCLPLMG